MSHLIYMDYTPESFFPTGHNDDRPRPPKFLALVQERERLIQCTLHEHWHGDKPAEIAKKLILLFNERFNSSSLAPAMLDTIFYKNRSTWEGLDRGLKIAARACQEQHDEYIYWDTMRFTVRNLRPNRASKQIYKLRESSEYYYSTRMSVCRYCWRAAFTKQHEKWSYCHIHEHKDSSRDYRDRIKYSKSVRRHSEDMLSDAFVNISDTIMPHDEIQIIRFCESHEELVNINYQELWLRAPYIIIEKLPNVLSFLNQLEANINSTKDIIATLEHPLPMNYTAFISHDIEENVDIKTHIRDINYIDFSSDYATYAPHLVWAEIWLKHENERPKHGGARKGAGRPHKTITTISAEK